MRKNILITAFCIALTMFPASVLASDLMEGITPNTISAENVIEAETSVFVTDFSVRLFQKSLENSENTLISPLSVLYALSMTANGAKGETLSQMETVLGMPINELNHYLYAFSQSIPADNKNKLNIANSIWINDEESFTVNREFLQINADYYDAGFYKTPFDDSALVQINDWVNDKTDGLIDKILENISADAVMYLINALGFEGEWKEIYEDYQIQDDIFTKEDGNEQSVSLMYSTENYYMEDENARGFLKHYVGEKYAFAAFLPDEGVSVNDYVESLTGEKVYDLIHSARETFVEAAVPKFESFYEVEMSEVFSLMGMTDAFDNDLADFSGLGESAYGNIFINKILHKTYLSLDAQGTKAAAVTAVEMAEESAAEMPEETEMIYLNRPFVYMLIDCEAGIPMFIGTVMSVE